MIQKITDKSLDFLGRHLTDKKKMSKLNGSFSLKANSDKYDLYGAVDAVYILYILGVLDEFTTKDSRIEWIYKILDCQDNDGWFTGRHYKRHSKEHASAYAIGALRILAEKDFESLPIKPVKSINNILSNDESFIKWINKLNLDYKRLSLNLLKLKIRNLPDDLGWHYIWKGSHYGAGVPAMISMTSHLYNNRFNKNDWFSKYFNWLDRTVSPENGYWQMGFWNLLNTYPNTIDLGGAVHFYWLYNNYSVDFPFPEALIKSTISIQKKSGLYRKKPFCIDLDGNFCIIRSFNQLNKKNKTIYHNIVHESIEQNYNGVISYLMKNSLNEIYTDLHGLPGALAAIAECSELDSEKFMSGYKNIFDKVCWL